MSDFDCGICLVRMVRPTSLPCGHTYCRACCLAMHDHVCPECRERFDVARLKDRVLTCKAMAHVEIECPTCALKMAHGVYAEHARTVHPETSAPTTSSVGADGAQEGEDVYRLLDATGHFNIIVRGRGGRIQLPGDSEPRVPQSTARIGFGSPLYSNQGIPVTIGFGSVQSIAYDSGAPPPTAPTVPEIRVPLANDAEAARRAKRLREQNEADLRRRNAEAARATYEANAARALNAWFANVNRSESSPCYDRARCSPAFHERIYALATGAGFFSSNEQGVVAYHTVPQRFHDC